MVTVAASTNAVNHPIELKNPCPGIVSERARAHLTVAAQVFYNAQVLPDNLKYLPGQRVRVNRAASSFVPEYVGVYGHIGIGGISAPHYFQRRYYVTLDLSSEAHIILRLPEHCLDDVATDFRL